MNFIRLPARFLEKNVPDDASLAADGVLSRLKVASGRPVVGARFGEIHLNSALNEPTKAEIDLIAATSMS